MDKITCQQTIESLLDLEHGNEIMLHNLHDLCAIHHAGRPTNYRSMGLLMDDISFTIIQCYH